MLTIHLYLSKGGNLDIVDTSLFKSICEIINFILFYFIYTHVSKLNYLHPREKIVDETIPFITIKSTLVINHIVRLYILHIATV